MEHGTYSASASGFSLLQPLTVEVTVSEGTIETEVLLVGMGGSGSVAALSAAETMYAANGNDTS